MALFAVFLLGWAESITDLLKKRFVFHIIEDVHPDVRAVYNALVEFVIGTSRSLKLNLTLKQC